jgi:hypothetical protein
VSTEAFADALHQLRKNLSGLAMSGLASALYWDSRHPKAFKMSAMLRESCLSSLRHRLGVLQPAAEASADLAGAIVAVDDLIRAGELGFTDRVSKLVRGLLSRVDGSGAVGEADQPATLLSQAMSVLALTRLAPTDADAAEGLSRVILAVELQGDSIRISGRDFAPDDHAVGFALLARACAATLLLPSLGHGLRPKVLERTQQLYRHSLHIILMQTTGSPHQLLLQESGRASARLQVVGILALFPPEALQSQLGGGGGDHNFQQKPVGFCSLGGTL